MVGSGTAQSSRCEPSRHQPDHLGRNLTPLGRSRGLGPPAGLIARTAFATPLRSGISRRPIVSRVQPQRRREVITDARLLYRGACGTGGPRDPHQRRPALSQVFPLRKPDCPDGFEPSRSGIGAQAGRAQSESPACLNSQGRADAETPAPWLRPRHGFPGFRRARCGQTQGEHMTPQAWAADGDIGFVNPRFVAP